MKLAIQAVTISVSDITQSKRFYEDILGFEPDSYYEPTRVNRHGKCPPSVIFDDPPDTLAKQLIRQEGKRSENRPFDC